MYPISRRQLLFSEQGLSVSDLVKGEGTPLGVVGITTEAPQQQPGAAQEKKHR